MRYLVYILAFIVCGCQNTTSTTKATTSTDTTVSDTLATIIQENKYRQIIDTTFSFNFSEIQFNAVYTGIGKYRCGLDFVDTINHINYHWIKLMPGFNTWTEEGHVDFSGIQLLFQGRRYYVPGDLSAEQIAWLAKSDTLNVSVDAWYVSGINNQPVKPTLLIKNVKKS